MSPGPLSRKFHDRRDNLSERESLRRADKTAAPIETQHCPALAVRVVQRKELGSEPAPRAGVIPGERTVAIPSVR
jgi:hypothetical protein